MEFIIHRVNLIEELRKTPQEYGCEIDIRTKDTKFFMYDKNNKVSLINKN